MMAMYDGVASHPSVRLLDIASDSWVGGRLSVHFVDQTRVSSNPGK